MGNTTNGGDHTTTAEREGLADYSCGAEGLANYAR